MPVPGSRHAWTGGQCSPGPPGSLAFPIWRHKALSASCRPCCRQRTDWTWANGTCFGSMHAECCTQTASANLPALWAREYRRDWPSWELKGGHRSRSGRHDCQKRVEQEVLEKPDIAQRPCLGISFATLTQRINITVRIHCALPHTALRIRQKCRRAAGRTPGLTADRGAVHVQLVGVS